MTPGVAIVVGLLTIVCGGVPLVLMALGVARPTDASSAPMWLGVAIGLVFVCAGFAVIFDYAIGPGRTPDGRYLPDTPSYVRVADTVIGLTIVGLMTAIFGWVAFGPGRREFSGSIAIPFLAAWWHPGETTGRIAFGFGALLFALVFGAFAISAGRRLRRAFRSAQSDGSVRVG